VRAFATAIAFALMTGGCANKTKPAPTHQDVVADSIGAATVRGVWVEAAEKGAVPDGWLRSFNDPKMEAVVVEVLRHNLALRGAATRVNAAAAAAIQAGAAMKPAIGVGASGNAGAGGGTGGGVGLNVSWEIDLWGRLASIKSAAEEQLASVQNDFEFARQSLAAQTAKAWYLASDAQQQLNLAKETVKLHEELARVVKTKADAGQVTPQDLNLANADLASARERERFAEGAHKEAVRSLEVLLGRYPSAELEVTDQSTPVPAAAPSGVPSEMLARRPDMVGAEAKVRAAFQNVQAAELAKLPRLTLSANGGIGGLANGFFGVGGNFFAPIDSNGALKAEVTIQTAEQEHALASYGQNALVAFNEVEKGLAAEKLLSEREQLFKTAVEQNEEALRQARVRFDVGKVSMIDVLQMQARVNRSRSALIDIRQQRLAQRIDLHLALGGSFETPAAATQAAARNPS
jgi:NodT family efflux transporter outer membrane factor (OMF) lipoprotein